MTKHISARIALLLAWAAGGLLLLALSGEAESINLPFTHWRLEAARVRAIALGIMMIAPVCLVVPARFSLASWVFLAASLVSIISGFHEPRRGDVIVWPAASEKGEKDPRTRIVWTSPTDWLEENSTYNERVGQRGAPGLRARHHTREFDVHYTHDEHGFRAMPNPDGPPPHPEILFLGCSFTYGIGVEDTETYPAILAAEAWRTLRVRNLAFSGHGTTHCLLALREALEGSTTPTAVLYGFIDAHLERNSLRRSWHHRLHAGKVPYFDERGEYHGLLDSPAVTMPDTPETAAIERRTTFAVLRRMREECQARGVPLFVLVFQNQDPTLQGELSELLGECLIDVRFESADRFDLDGHPTPRAHRQIASALASNPVLAKVTGIDDLFPPGAIKLPPEPDTMRRRLMRAGERTWASARPLESDPGAVRLEGIQLSSDLPFEVGLTRPGIPIQRGRTYFLRLRARADAPRRVIASVVSLIPARDTCGLACPLELTEEWRDYSIRWIGAKDEVHTMLAVYAGGSDIPLEVARMEVRELSPEEWASFHVQTNENDLRNYARITATEGGARQGFRLEQISSPSGINWHVRAERRGLTVKAGKRYRVTGRARADAPRPVEIVVLRDEAPYPTTGLNQRLELTDRWLDFDFTYAATLAGPAVLSIQAGESEVPLEFEDVTLEAADETLEK